MKDAVMTIGECISKNKVVATNTAISNYHILETK